MKDNPETPRAASDEKQLVVENTAKGLMFRLREAQFLEDYINGFVSEEEWLKKYRDATEMLGKVWYEWRMMENG